MSPLESLALLVADLNTQVRALQEENADLRNTANVPRVPPVDMPGVT